jgi:hypothetical protein
LTLLQYKLKLQILGMLSWYAGARQEEQEMAIGFLGSIKHKVVEYPSGNMVDAEKGFRDGFGGTIDHENAPDGKYKHLDLDAADLVANNINLICATGGLPAAKAAATAAKGQIPVLVIVGKMPTPTGVNPYDDLSGQNIAGINLGTSANISQAAALLAGKLGQSTTQNIVLLVNKASQVGKDEKTDWENGGGKCLPYDPPDDNDPHHIASIIRPMLDAAKANGAVGVVVSADPFFNLNRKELSKAVDRSGLAGCYSFLEYINDGEGSYYYGPRLYSQYKSLGAMAKQVLGMPQAQRTNIRASVGIVMMAPDMIGFMESVV